MTIEVEPLVSSSIDIVFLLFLLPSTLWDSAAGAETSSQGTAASVAGDLLVSLTLSLLLCIGFDSERP